MKVLGDQIFWLLQLTYFVTIFFEYESTRVAIRNAEKYAKSIGNATATETTKYGLTLGYFLEWLFGALFIGILSWFIISEQGTFNNIEYLVFYTIGLILLFIGRNFIYGWIVNKYTDHKIRKAQSSQIDLIKRAQQDVENGTMRPDELERLMSIYNQDNQGGHK